MCEVGVYNWKIVPLLTFACNWETIHEFELQWVKTTGANLNTFSPFGDDVEKRGKLRQYYKKNKETKRYNCGLCNVSFRDNSHLKTYFDTLKHSYAWLNSLD